MITVNFLFHDLVAKSLTRSAPLLLIATLALGCNRDEVQVYRVAKEPPEPSATGAGMPPGHPEIGASPSEVPASAGAPTLAYKTPAGWKRFPLAKCASLPSESKGLTTNWPM